MADEVLVARALEGDVVAFEELVVRYQRPVYAVCYRMLGQKEDAEDLAQEVFLTVYEKLNYFDLARVFAPWLYRIAVNCCLSRLRKNRKVVFVNFDDGIYTEPDIASGHQDNPVLALERLEQKEAIEQSLMELPDSYRMVLVLRYQLDLTNQEIASMLGITRENVEVRIHRARKALRKVLASPTRGGWSYELPASR
ncbi:MAG: RNA polymerase sigma factor [Methanomassiliicoccales archaeon]